MLHRVSRLIALATLGASASLAAQNYASAVAIGGREVFIGQPANQYSPGMVYVYRQDAGGMWRQAAKLMAPDAKNDDGFGRGLAVEGNTLLVGQTSADSGRGIVLVFSRDAAGAWRQSGRITAPDASPSDNFGRSIVLSGDLAFVSSAREQGRGAVYVFGRGAGGGGTWAAETTLAPADTAPNQGFGASIAGTAMRLVVGSARVDSGNGAAYVFTRDAARGPWHQEARLVPFTGSRNSAFGTALLLRVDTLLVGAPGSDRNAGVVYVFGRDSTGRWTPGTRLFPFDAIGPAQFGATLAQAGSELWVGAPLAGRFQGRVYRYSGDSTGWTGVSKMQVPDLQQGNAFGGSMVVSGSVAVVGIPGQDFGEGAAALYSRGPAGWRFGSRVLGEVASLPAMTGATRECAGGKVGIFGCNQVSLLSFLPVSAIGGKRGVVLNDLWGYTDPQTGHEYALVGRADGTSFVDLTDASHPVYLGDLPKTSTAVAAVWRDIKVYQHYAFIVSDGARDHGMQVFDLDKLRNVARPPVTFTEDAHYSRIHSAHNIVIDTATGYAFIVGASSGGEMCGGGLHMVDIRKPLQPAFAGCFSDPATGRSGTGYTHDAECVVYHGPDQKYQGHEVCFAENETALSIADVTDKAHPVAVSHQGYPNVGYAHQGWLTADQRYLYQDDELDEIEKLVTGTRTLIWDVSDLANPVLAGEYVSQDHAIDHNLYVVGDTVYESNYLSGLRVLDITDRLHPREVGYFDTVPVGEDVAEFGGSWSNYPFYKSGAIAVTSMREGLFIVKNHATPAVP